MLGKGRSLRGCEISGMSVCFGCCVGDSFFEDMGFSILLPLFLIRHKERASTKPTPKQVDALITQRYLILFPNFHLEVFSLVVLVLYLHFLILFQSVCICLISRIVILSINSPKETGARIGDKSFTFLVINFHFFCNCD